VVVAAIDVLIAEGVEQASALTGALNNVLQRYDRLRALVDCRLHYAENSHPIKLPTDIVTILQTVAAFDRRQFPGERNYAAAHAGELWSRWFEALLTDADAKVTFEQSPILDTGGTADATLPMAHRRRDLDAADADAHERADLEQLETNGAAGGLGELSVVETNTARSAQQDISHRVEPQAELVAPHRGCDPHRGRAGTP